MLWEPSFAEESDAMPQTVPNGGYSPPLSSQGERAVPGSPADIHHLLRILGASSPPESMLHPPTLKPPPPYPEDIYDFNYLTPSPSIDEGASTVAYQPSSPYDIKEERLAIPDFASPYPLSPSGSCVSYASINQYSSPVPQHDEYIDIEELLKENQIDQDRQVCPKIEQQRDHVLLRSALEDTTFQKRMNLRPFCLELGSVKMEEVDGNEANEGNLAAPDIDEVLSMAIEQSKRDVDSTCEILGISPDPANWSRSDVKSWVTFTLQQYNLPAVPSNNFDIEGRDLVSLTEQDFDHRAPMAGSTLYAQLEIWKASRPDAWRWNDSQPQAQSPTVPLVEDMSDDDDPELVAGGSSASSGKLKTGSTHIHLWQFLKELLATPDAHGSAIRWIDRGNGVFKIEDSVRVARLWGKRKNRPAMNYDKLSRSIRQYYKKGIMKKTERSQRLVYQFCHPYSL